MYHLRFKTGALLAAISLTGIVSAQADFGFGGGPSALVSILTPTTNAPASARGLAILGVDELNSTNPPSLHVGAEGLSLGTYTVSIVDAATNTFVLGTFDIMNFGDWGGEEEITNILGSITVGEADLPLPAGLNPTNVVTVSVSDS